MAPDELHTPLLFEVEEATEAKTSTLAFYGGDHTFLRCAKRPSVPQGLKTVRVVDLFSGCGGLSLGVQEACRELKLGFEVRRAIDSDQAALSCYEANFPNSRTDSSDVGELFAEDFASSASEAETALASSCGDIDLLVGGPPCQGHSDLNNYTRRRDPKNRLFLYMARAARILKPQHVVIENVVPAAHDRDGVVKETVGRLNALGYRTSVGILDLARIGVPQRRRRLFVVGSRSSQVNLLALQTKYMTNTRTVEWAISDIVDERAEGIVSEPANSAPATLERINYLFENELFDLPMSQRPACHRDKDHTYNSVYGRLSWSQPAQTITSGFYSMCMGRYVHPSRRRTLIAREAARLQFFPDFFDFRPAQTRTNLATIIGNAVPMKASYLILRELMSA